MIKVNLLKSYTGSAAEALQVAEENPGQTAAFLKHVAVMLLGVVALFIHESINIPELTKQLKGVTAEIGEATRFNQRMGPLKKEIEKYEKDLNRLNTQMEFLNRVQKERALSVELINRIRFAVPERVWLTSIQASGTSIDVKGEAESTNDVNEFNARLASESYLKDVVIVSSVLKMVNKTPLQTFNIKASYADIAQMANMDSQQGVDAPAPPPVEPGETQ